MRGDPQHGLQRWHERNVREEAGGRGPGRRARRGQDSPVNRIHDERWMEGVPVSSVRSSGPAAGMRPGSLEEEVQAVGAPGACLAEG